MNILIEPIITEKMNKQSQTQHRYGFFVDKRANKIEIKKAVEATYGVTVEKVHTMISPGKPRSRITRSGIARGRTGACKKAIVVLSKGEEIDFFSHI